MKKFIDIDGLKIFVERVRKEIDRNVTMLINTQNNLFGGVYQAMGWVHKGTPFINELTANSLTGNNLVEAIATVNNLLAPDSSIALEYGGAFERINWLKEKLGASDAEAGTGTAFARIKKLEDADVITENLSTTTDMDYLFDLYVTHDASTISTEDKNAIITTAYGDVDFKPEYLS